MSATSYGEVETVIATPCMPERVRSPAPVAWDEVQEEDEDGDDILSCWSAEASHVDANTASCSSVAQASGTAASALHLQSLAAAHHPDSMASVLDHLLEAVVDRTSTAQLNPPPPPARARTEEDWATVFSVLESAAAIETSETGMFSDSVSVDGGTPRFVLPPPLGSFSASHRQSLAPPAPLGNEAVRTFAGESLLRESEALSPSAWSSSTDSVAFSGGMDDGLVGALRSLAVADLPGLPEELLVQRVIAQVQSAPVSDALSEAEINALPRVYFDSSEPATCSICLEQCNQGELLNRLHCGHYFHVVCLTSWMRRAARCPLCREDQATYA